MIKTKKVILLLIAVMVLLPTNCLPAFASPIDTIQILEEIDLPTDLDFSVKYIFIACVEYVFDKSVVVPVD